MVVVAVKSCGQFYEAAVGQENGVVADAQNLVAWDGRRAAEVAVGAAGGHGCEIGFAVKVAVVAAGGHGCEIGFPVEVAVVAAGGHGCEIGFAVKVTVGAAGGYRREVRLVGQIVVIATEAGGQLHEAAIGQEYGVVADGQHLALGERGQVAGIVGESAHVSGNSRDGGLVGKIVVVATRGDGREIGFPVKVVVVAAGGYRREVRLVGEVIVVAVKTFGQFHEAAVGQENSVVADTQHLVGGDVALHGHAGGLQRVHHLGSGAGGEVVGEVAAEAVAGLLRVQCVGDAQELLHGAHQIAAAAGRVNLRQQEEGTVGPVDVGEVAGRGGSAADFYGHQAVGVGGHVVQFRIDDGAGGTALHDGDACRHILVNNQGVGTVAYHGLVGHFLGSLRHHSESGQNEEEE